MSEKFVIKNKNGTTIFELGEVSAFLDNNGYMPEDGISLDDYWESIKDLLTDVSMKYTAYSPKSLDELHDMTEHIKNLIFESLENAMKLGMVGVYLEIKDTVNEKHWKLVKE